MERLPHPKDLPGSISYLTEGLEAPQMSLCKTPACCADWLGSSSQILHPSHAQTDKESKDDIVFTQKSNYDQSRQATSGHSPT